MSEAILLENVRTLVQTELNPLVEKIDRQGMYPEAFMYHLGEIGAYACVGEISEGGNGLGLATQIAVINEVSKICGTTAFSIWCQAACAWYLHQSPNQAVRVRYLADVLQGKVLAGTGMSNTVKHLAGIEAHNLQAQKVEGGYYINGALPWVSNLGENHIWANTAQTSDGYVMFMTSGKNHGVQLNPCPEFCALEGSATFALKLDNVFIADEDIIATPAQFSNYIKNIKAGFILLQIGICTGIIESCLHEIALTAHQEINLYLDHSYDELKTRFKENQIQTIKLAQLAWQQQPKLLETLRLRAACAELCLDTARSAALHTGAKGYLMSSPVQRRLREAMFTAIVTPSLKHLRKEINELEFIGGEFSI